jgi:hypothetical protein
MKFWNHLLAGLVLTLLPAPLLACSCAPWSLGFCQTVPDTWNAARAVFVGQGNRGLPEIQGRDDA